VQLSPSSVVKLATLEGGSCTVSEAVVTVLCTHSTCFGCQPHPSWVHKTVITASVTVQLPPSSVVKLATLEGGSCTVPEAVFTVLCTHSTCFGCQPHPSWVHKTVTIASVNVQLPPSNLVTLEGGSCTKNMTSTGGCSYSFVYSWCWVWLTPETCSVNPQNNE